MLTGHDTENAPRRHPLLNTRALPLLAAFAVLAAVICFVGTSVGPQRQISSGTELTLTWSDCGGAEAAGRVVAVDASKIVVGATTVVPVTVAVEEAVPAADVVVNATTWSEGLQLMTLQDDVCAPANGLLHLGRMYLGKLHFTGLSCPVQKGPLTFSVKMALTPPLYAPKSFKRTVTNITASAPGRGQIFCATLRTFDPADSELPEEKRGSALLLGATGHQSASGVVMASNGHPVAGYAVARKEDDSRESGGGSRLVTGALLVTGHDQAAGINMARHDHAMAGVLVARP
jgi:hypothetical protein